jgi:type II secretory pathway pseudopilin PulG
MIVTAVIGVLATISIVGFSNIQASSRDTQRSDKIAAISEALEKYYSANGEYPDCYAMSQQPASAVTSGGTAALPGLDPTNLQAPTASVGTNSITCGELTPGSSLDAFGYVGDGSTTCSNNSSVPVGSCLQYTLEYRQEVTGNIIKLASRHSTQIATSGTVSLSSATASSFTQVGLVWNNISNATYNVEYSTDPTFATSPGTVSATASPYTVTGLNYGTLYYFRVMPVSPLSSGSWSSSLSATTYSMSAPTVTAGTISNSTIQINWGAVTNAADYNVQVATGSTFNSANDIYNGSYGGSLSAPSYTATGLTVGNAYSFVVTPLNGAFTGTPSAPITATTIVPAPTCTTATDNSVTQITATWCAVSVATTYTLEYSTSSSFSSPTDVTGIAAGTLTKAVTGLTQGEIYYFHVYALVGSATSLASPSANATTTINAPGTPSLNAIRPTSPATRAEGSGDWIVDPGAGTYYTASTQASTGCSAGSTPAYHINAIYSGTSTNYAIASTYGGPWYITQPRAGYSVTFSAYAWCIGNNATSGNSGTNSATATD